VPTDDPFTNHWYDGVIPPDCGVAIHVTVVSAQTGLAERETETETGKRGFTDTGYWMLDAGLFDVQISEDVSAQLTRSPLSGINE
jgi:hypothetical protein